MHLAIDTSQSACAVAILDPASQTVLASDIADLGRGHAEHLMPRIRAVLDSCKISVDQLTKIGAVCGPGSFTGLRVGLAAARGLALALDIDCVGVPALPVLAQQAVAQSTDVDHIFVVQDARRDQAFCQLFDAAGTPVGAAGCFKLDTVESLLPAGPTLIVGSGAELVCSTHSNPDRSPQTALTSGIADIEVVAHMVAGLDRESSPPIALYLRTADAKVQTGFAVERQSA